ncbi:MAG: hypothetical protein KME31_13840 [Tolypothrix carrinoi HA7290-LM1]|nr:hypothetical protein [Tolypothrix carrinoi HA7290-LM1]
MRTSVLTTNSSKQFRDYFWENYSTSNEYLIFDDLKIIASYHQKNQAGLGYAIAQY